MYGGLTMLGWRRPDIAHIPVIVVNCSMARFTKLVIMRSSNSTLRLWSRSVRSNDELPLSASPTAERRESVWTNRAKSASRISSTS